MTPSARWEHDRSTAELSGDVLYFRYRGLNGLAHAQWSVGVAGEAVARGAQFMVADVRDSEVDLA